MNKIKFKTQKMRKIADLKLRFKLYQMMIKKYFKNIGHSFKIFSGALAAIVTGIFIVFNFSGSNMLATTQPEIKTISTSEVLLSKENREKRVMAYYKESQLNRLNSLKTQKYKDLSFKRRLVNN